MPYIPHTDADRREMLQKIGVGSMEELFSPIPAELRAKPLEMPAGMSEEAVRREMQKLAGQNAVMTSFLGGGFYDHYIPAAVDALAGRSEFYTAYTPYQPEMSQGFLQAMYEYQSAICRLTGMEASNASLYDGGTGLYEAVRMATTGNPRRRVILDECVNPTYRKMVETHAKNLHLEIVTVAHQNGAMNRDELKKQINDQTAAVVIANPNFFGVCDDYSDIVEAAHKAGAMAIASVYGISLALLKSPGEMGFDIAVGEGQCFGNPLSSGGPYLGFIGTLKKHVRKMPGRIIGQTVDSKGRRGFVMTLQAREQHIRREKATSNICSNEGHCALRAIIYLSLVGKGGLRTIGEACVANAHEAHQKLTGISGITAMNNSPFFNEFAIKLPGDAAETVAKAMKKKVVPGLPLGTQYDGLKNYLLVAVTEKHTQEDIASLAGALEAAL